MILYAVFKQGVYRHECGGIFDDVQLAKDAAIGLIANEPDQRHSYQVVPFMLNNITNQLVRKDVSYDEGKLIENPVLFEFKKIIGEVNQTK